MHSSVPSGGLSATKPVGERPDLGFVAANRRAYDALVQRAVSLWERGSPVETTLNRVVRAAAFAERFHPGLFADAVLENLTLRIGREHLSAPASARGAAKGRRHILHVASTALAIGGHTRMLHEWITQDRDSGHDVFLTQQSAVPVPNWLSVAVATTGGQLFCPRTSERIEAARQLREVANLRADLVVLLHGGSDPVPTLAFGRDGGPPVATVNHADHAFWLGSSVTDMLVNLRPAAAPFAERRFIERATLLPIPLSAPTGCVDRRVARARLGIAPDQLVLLTVGRGEKYRPCGGYDFFATMRRILDRHPGAHLYLVGETREGLAPFLNAAPHERVHLVGAVEDPTLYRMAADLYLESFPFGSNTALLEAARDGLAVVPAYAPLCPLVVAGNASLDPLLPHLPTEAAYLARVDELLADRDGAGRFARRLRDSVVALHTGAGWRNRLADVVLEIEGCRHAVRELPAVSAAPTSADHALALRTTAADGQTLRKAPDPGSLADVARHGAFVCRDASHFRGALVFALRAVLAQPTRWMSWRLLLLAIGGAPLRRLGQALRASGTRSPGGAAAS